MGFAKIPGSIQRTDPVVNFCGKVSKFCGKLWGNLWKPCGNSVEFLGKTPVKDKNCKQSKSQELLNLC
jgi:hypothetical protein